MPGWLAGTLNVSTVGAEMTSRDGTPVNRSITCCAANVTTMPQSVAPLAGRST